MLYGEVATLVLTAVNTALKVANRTGPARAVAAVCRLADAALA